MDVGFPDHLGVPGGTDNVAARTEPYKGGTRFVITEVDLMTECDSDISANQVNPTPADACQAAGLHINGPETKDTQTFFEHGVPRFKGYFAAEAADVRTGEGRLSRRTDLTRGRSGAGVSAGMDTAPPLTSRAEIASRPRS